MKTQPSEKGSNVKKGGRKEKKTKTSSRVYGFSYSGVGGPLEDLKDHV